MQKNNNKKNTWESLLPQTPCVLAWPSGSCFSSLPTCKSSHNPPLQNPRVVRKPTGSRLHLSGQSISRTHLLKNCFVTQTWGPRSELPHRPVWLSAWLPVNSSLSGVSLEDRIPILEEKVLQLLCVSPRYYYHWRRTTIWNFQKAFKTSKVSFNSAMRQRSVCWISHILIHDYSIQFYITCVDYISVH